MGQEFTSLTSWLLSAKCRVSVTVGGILVSYKNGSLQVFSCFARFLMKKIQESVLNMASSESQIDKPQRGCPKRAKLPDVNINTGAQSINTERASLKVCHGSLTMY